VIYSLSDKRFYQAFATGTKLARAADAGSFFAQLPQILFAERNFSPEFIADSA
jgi:hypothetical protein